MLTNGTNSGPLQPSAASARPKCQTCRFWGAVAGPGGLVGPISANTQGECHHAPPRAQMVPNGNGFGFVGVFPPVAAGEWCGDHDTEGADHA